MEISAKLQRGKAFKASFKFKQPLKAHPIFSAHALKNQATTRPELIKDIKHMLGFKFKGEFKFPPYSPPQLKWELNGTNIPCFWLDLTSIFMGKSI
ncbi:hypothetical protein Lal_00044266, partial [Lupinus albus]